MNSTKSTSPEKKKKSKRPSVSHIACDYLLRDLRLLLNRARRHMEHSIYCATFRGALECTCGMTGVKADIDRALIK